MKKYFGTDGIRGRVGQPPISADWILKLGWAVGKVLTAKSRGTRSKVLIGKDTRISGYLFESALEAGFSSAGVDTLLLGPMSTPGVARLTTALRASIGIVISASHNPYYDNGIKFFSAEGTKLPDEMEFLIEKTLECPLETVDSRALGKARRVQDAEGRCIEFCKSTFPSTLDLRGSKIVVDCANGATYKIAPNVFKELGADVVEMGVSPDGFNINDGCGATCPLPLAERVIKEKAHLGIALDGDGDRVIMVDHTGAVVDGDELLFIIARWYAETDRLKGGVVGTTMSNYGLEIAFKALNIPFLRTAVGDRYILEMLKNKGWILGGESSGHILCLDANTTGDGIVSALRVLAVMAFTGRSLKELKEGMTKSPQILINVPIATRANVIDHPSITSAVTKAESRLNGRGRVLLRASGTEALVRVMVEGQDSSMVELVAEELAEVVKGAMV
jgi:phosphoglucosamine mutase